ncbi:chaperone dnaJ 72 [Micractinium conductrix]|uniref:Chaperone dnaJ 72 n=1 Tax=Micractinium conductrix TaxID=554055 RepID=A0A2P6V3L5_9CHLO|nr:chaperone dnaJ 72 [Micractinium conductrix]|eukprot:PSC68691.1 chaperone dnaJ 72 [Micractinium conductrix]
MDAWAVLGVQPGASKTDIKKAFRLKAKAHHPDMHATASDGVKAAHDAAFRTLNEAYQQLMDGSVRVRQRPSAAAYGRAGYTGAAAGQRAGGGYSGAYNPFDSYHGSGTGGSYSGWRQYQRRGGLDFRAAFRAFTSISRAEAAATAALGLLLAGGALLLEDASQALWAAHNQGKLFEGIQEDVQWRKQQKEDAAAAAAAGQGHKRNVKGGGEASCVVC